MKERDAGKCKQTMGQYFFDRREGKCKPFVYSGCGGNNNRFNSYTSCERTCMKKDNMSKYKEAKSILDTVCIFNLYNIKYKTCLFQILILYFISKNESNYQI